MLINAFRLWIRIRNWYTWTSHIFANISQYLITLATESGDSWSPLNDTRATSEINSTARNAIALNASNDSCATGLQKWEKKKGANERSLWETLRLDSQRSITIRRHRGETRAANIRVSECRWFPFLFCVQSDLNVRTNVWRVGEVVLLEIEKMSGYFIISSGTVGTFCLNNLLKNKVYFSFDHFRIKMHEFLCHLSCIYRSLLSLYYLYVTSTMMLL